MTYRLDENGIYRPLKAVAHRNDEYNEAGFNTLVEMQSKHFWYLGRHKFLEESLFSHVNQRHRTMIDLGGGVGGWLRYLLDHHPERFKEMAMGDSSDIALKGARSLLGNNISLYQQDLMNLEWQNRWDVIFLLDVIEHCPDDTGILKQVLTALKPGGRLIVTTPALMCFWSHNDDYANHLRRYNIQDYQKLAASSGFRLLDARYFMFFLSPLYFLSRKARSKNASREALEAAIEREHRVPGPLLNNLLTKIFSAETPIGHKVHFPWGTSILGVFEKPDK